MKLGENNYTLNCFSMIFFWFKRLHFILFYFNVYSFLRERQSASGGGPERERETQNLKQAPGSGLSAESQMWGSNSQTVRS